MSQVEHPEPDRFHVNPIEAVITVAIGAVFLNSLYQLIYPDPASATASALVAMKASPTSDGRHPLSVNNPTLLNLTVECKPKVESATSASKARIQGDFCGIKPTEDGIRLSAATITNTSNQFAATVFAQNDSHHFSTDFIPLVQGPNKIRVEFSYSGGPKTFAQDLIITRN